MTWRGSSTSQDRIFASLVYLVPLLDALPFGFSFMNQFLGIDLIALMSFPLIRFYYAPFIPFVVFFALYALVVKNENIAHFIRFNTMQAILMGIVLSLIEIIWPYFPGSILGVSPALEILGKTLLNTVFLGAVIAVGYSIVQSVLGRYAEIPTISEAAYSQVR